MAHLPHALGLSGLPPGSQAVISRLPGGFISCSLAVKRPLPARVVAVRRAADGAAVRRDGEAVVWPIAGAHEPLTRVEKA